jgi:splicing factor 3B subunit 3
LSHSPSSCAHFLCSLTTVEFTEKGPETFLAVGVVKDMTLQPRSISSASINLYRFQADFRKLELVHEVCIWLNTVSHLTFQTPVDAVPLALAPFQGRLLAGVGSALRIYDIGKKKLLRKSENRSIPTTITWIQSRGDRIFVGDMGEAFHILKYRKAEKQMMLFADCNVPRYLTASTILDYNTVAGADKFGNIFVSRLPEDVSEENDRDIYGGYEGEGWLNGAPNRMKDVINFHVGDTITSLQKVSMIPGDAGVLLYATISGGIGVMIPFVSREDIDFLSHLEMQLRQAIPPICGRDHMAFRSYYFPVKDTVDGDLCEQYNTLPYARQAEIAASIGCEVGDIVRKLEEMRARFV